MVSPAIIVLTQGAMPLAARLKSVLGDCDIHGRSGRVSGADETFTEASRHIPALFAAGRPIIGLCAAGILIRLLAPHLTNKRGEPPVVAVAEDGSAVVPLIGGHRGANDLARTLAHLLGVAPAITTAGDALFGIALDAPPSGWTLANPADAKPVMAALVAGGKARIEGRAPWLSASSLPVSEQGGVTLAATHLADSGGPARLVYHPRVLALGVGCERCTDAAELIALAEKTIADNGLAPQALAAIVSLDLKADEAAIHALAARFGVPARFFSREALAKETPRLATPSRAVEAEVGVAGVAEAAALAASGPDGQLAVPKQKSSRATCAVALAPEVIDTAATGRARGRLAVVGIGPGGADWLSPEAERLLRDADDWVGYGLYLDLVARLGSGKAQHRFELGEEEVRVKHALELAGTGRNVALVSSGDPGIYAMAALACELMDAESGAEIGEAARRAELVVAPGISAFQAAAARAGAPLGHDFCLISLSDLLTPWQVIERRIRAAAEGDFAVAFYNPKSKRRADGLDKALAILKGHRPAATPVVIAANLGREGERIDMVSLDRVDTGTIDMLTLVIVGASQTRTYTTGDGRSHVYTPRGYAARRERAS